MSTEKNNQDVTIDEQGGDVAEQLSADEVAALKERAEKVEELERNVGSLKRDLKKAQKQIEDTKNVVDPKETPEQTPQSNEPDYAKIAYLEAKGINNADDMKTVMEEADRLKLPLTDVLSMEHMQTKLKNAASEREAQDGMPDGSGRKGGAAKNSVDYFLAHPDETPSDLDLHNEVIEARMKNERNANKFSDTPVVNG